MHIHVLQHLTRMQQVQHLVCEWLRGAKRGERKGSSLVKTEGHILFNGFETFFKMRFSVSTQRKSFRSLLCFDHKYPTHGWHHIHCETESLVDNLFISSPFCDMRSTGNIRSSCYELRGVKLPPMITDSDILNKLIPHPGFYRTRTLFPVKQPGPTITVPAWITSIHPAIHLPIHPPCIHPFGRSCCLFLN